MPRDEPVILPKAPESSPENAPDCAHSNDISIAIVPATGGRLGRGKARYDRGDLDGAAAELIARLVEEPGDTEARLILGDIYERKGRFREAVDQYLEAERLAPGDKMLRLKLETALRQVGK